MLRLQVLYARDNVAIIEGLNNDADVGTVLAFSSGARGYEAPAATMHRAAASSCIRPGCQPFRPSALP